MFDKKIEVNPNFPHYNKKDIQTKEQNSILSETMSDSNFNYSLDKINQTQTENTIIIPENKKQVENDDIDEELSAEIKEQIAKMVDAQFSEEYNKLNQEFNDKIEELINEQEMMDDKYEIIKAKYDALEEYIKNYCKRNNIDFNSLLQDG
jgi:hypothetical protein